MNYTLQKCLSTLTLDRFCSKLIFGSVPALRSGEPKTYLQQQVLMPAPSLGARLSGKAQKSGALELATQRQKLL